MDSCLLILDFQNDIINSSPRSDKVLEVVPKLNNLKKDFKITVFGIQQHPKTHHSFKEFDGSKDPHCVDGTYGCELNSGIVVEEQDFIVPRGTLNLFDSDSGFWNSQEKKKGTDLLKILKNSGVSKLYILGVDAEIVVFSTALDAVKFKYDTYVVEDVCVYTDADKWGKCLDFLKTVGVKTIQLIDILKN